MFPSRRCVVRTSIFGRCSGARANAITARIARLAMIGAAACALAGCATDEEYRRAAYTRDAARQNVAQQQQRQRATEPEVEDDGLPSQVPPPANRRREADDPREPYSPNYGSPVTPAAQPQPRRAAASTYAPPSDAFQPRVSRIAAY